MMYNFDTIFIFKLNLRFIKLEINELVC